MSQVATSLHVKRTSAPGVQDLQLAPCHKALGTLERLLVCEHQLVHLIPFVLPAAGLLYFHDVAAHVGKITEFCIHPDNVVLCSACPSSYAH